MCMYVYVYIYILGAALASLSVGSLGSPMLITKFIWPTRKLFTNCHERRTCKETNHRNCKSYSQKLWWNHPN